MDFLLCAKHSLDRVGIPRSQNKELVPECEEVSL